MLIDSTHVCNVCKSEDFVKFLSYVMTLFSQDSADGFKDLVSTFFWPDIGKLYFEVNASHFVDGTRFSS